MTNSIQRLVPPLFPLRRQRNRCFRGVERYRRNRMLERALSREAGIFRHHLAETAMRGLVVHVFATFRHASRFSQERKTREPSSSRESPRDTVHTPILLEEPPYVNVATSAMLNRNFPPPNAARLETRRRSTSRFTWLETFTRTSLGMS